MSTKPTVVIIGAGYAGTAVATALEKTNLFTIRLIDRQNYFYHNVGSVRGCVDEKFTPKTLLPLDKIFKNPLNKVLQATVTLIDKDHIFLDRFVEESTLLNNESYSFKFDYLLISTGSSYAAPFKAIHNQRDEQLLEMKKYTDAIKDAQTIVFIGGGPTAIETASEVKTLYPKKDVTVVTSGSKLIPGHVSDKFRAKLDEKLKEISLKVRYHIRIDDLPSADELLKPQTLKTNTGEEINADLFIKCVGFNGPNSSFAKQMDSLDDKGFIKVNEFLQVKGFENIFSCGDVSDADSKLAFMAGKQAPIIVKNLVAILKKTKLTAYVKSDPTKPFIIVPVGKDKGAAQFGGMGVFGSFVSRNVKGKDLFTTPNWKNVNQPLPK